MDPNACLAHIRAIVQSFDHASDDEARAGLGSELVDYVSGMDTWLSKGGFLPHEWIKSVDNYIDK